jgi:hypothetical protein
MAIGARVRSREVHLPSLPRFNTEAAIPWLLPLIILVLWQLSLSLGLFKAHQLPPP